MADAGYSGTPLQKKLGYKEGWRVAVVGPAPDDFAGQFEGVAMASSARGAPDAAHLFTTSRADLSKRAPALLDKLGDAGVLWVSWPKKSSGVATDLTEDVLREVLLPSGWVDVKVCAVDEVWSGLKFVKRLANRGV